MAPRTPLLRPDRYFAQRNVGLLRGLVLTAVLTVAAMGAVWGLGVVFADKIDGTVAVDNPNRPPEPFCENGMNATFEQVNASSFDCGAPAQIERDVDTVVDDAVGQFYVPMLVGLPFLWLFAGVLLHAGTSLCGGEGRFGESLTVAAWGFTPMLVVLPVSLALLWLRWIRSPSRRVRIPPSSGSRCSRASGSGDSTR